MPANFIILKLKIMLVPRGNELSSFCNLKSKVSYDSFHFCLLIFGHNVCPWVHVTERGGFRERALIAGERKRWGKDLEQIRAQNIRILGKRRIWPKEQGFGLPCST